MHNYHTIKGVELKNLKFSRIHSAQTALYGLFAMRNPFDSDDKEILAELFAFSATLTPLV